MGREILQLYTFTIFFISGFIISYITSFCIQFLYHHLPISP